MGFTVGSISSNTGTAIDQAQNGLSVINPSPGDYITILGNDVGDASQPAKLLTNREIPTNAKNITLQGTGNLIIDQGKIGVANAAPSDDITIGTFGGTHALRVIGANAGINLTANGGSASVTFGSTGIAVISTPTRNFSFNQPAAMGVVGGYSWITFDNGLHAQTSGNGIGLDSRQVFNPLSGTANWTAFNFSDSIDQQGGANGISRIIHIQTGLINAVDFRCFEISTNAGQAFLQTNAGATNQFIGFTGFGIATPLTRVHIGAGTAAIGPLRIAPGGVLLAVPVSGTLESTGDNIYFTTNTGAVRRGIPLLTAATMGSGRILFSNGGFMMESTSFNFDGTNIAMAIGAAVSTTVFILIGAGTSAKAPFRYTAGVNTAAIVDGNKEFNGSNEFISAGGVRYTLAKTLQVVATLDFPNTAPQTTSTLTVAVTGAADGDQVVVGVPFAAQVGISNCIWSGLVTSAGVVTISFTNNDAALSFNPPSGDYKVGVIKP
jgi:hypothetical protein